MCIYIHTERSYRFLPNCHPEGLLKLVERPVLWVLYLLCVCVVFVVVVAEEGSRVPKVLHLSKMPSP